LNHYKKNIDWIKKVKFPYIIYEKEQLNKEPLNAINKAKSESNICKFIYMNFMTIYHKILLTFTNINTNGIIKEV